jgi:hypothetical protein
VSDCTGNGDPTIPDECDDKAADIAFILDSSGSITGAGWNELLAAVGNIVTGLDISASPARMQVAARAFSSSHHSFPGFNLNEHYGWSNVKNQINQMSWLAGGTLLGAAIANTNQNVLVASGGRRANVPAAMIIVTDGMTADLAVAQAEAAIAKANGVKVFTIGVNNFNINLLGSMASPDESDGTTYKFALAGFDVDAFKTQLLKAICQEPAPTTTPALAIARFTGDEIHFAPTDMWGKYNATTGFETCACADESQYVCKPNRAGSCCTRSKPALCETSGTKFTEAVVSKNRRDDIDINKPGISFKEDGGPNGWHTCTCADGSTYECKSKFGDGKQCCTRSMPAICGNDDGKVKSVAADFAAVPIGDKPDDKAPLCPEPGADCRRMTDYDTGHICGPGRVCVVQPANPPQDPCPYESCMTGAPDHYYVN